MRRLSIMVVCGFGVGTSLVLKMKIDDVLRGHGIDAEVFTADVTSATGERCDVVFTSRELAGSFAGARYPVVVIDNFLSAAEIEAKGLPVLQGLLAR